MLFVAFTLLAALVVFALGYALAVRGARRRLAVQAMRAAAAYEDLESRLAKLGAGLGVGA